MRVRHAEKPYCNIDEHVPASAHKKLLEQKNQDIERYKAENLALRAILGVGDTLTESTQLLTELASALIAGEQAGWSHPTQTQDTPRITTTPPGSTPPTGGNPAARRAWYRLVGSVRNRIDSFHTRMDNDWKDPYFTYDED